MADEDRDESYQPTSVEVDRGRQQGLGMGARDLDGQREPTDGIRMAQRRFAGAEGGEAADMPLDDRPAGPPGRPDPAYDAGEGDGGEDAGSAGPPGDGGG